MNGFSTNFLRNILAILLLAFNFSGYAATTSETTIQQRFKDHLGIDVKKDTIIQTPYSNLYEVQIGENIIYTDKQAQYLFMGKILNLETKENYTQNKLRKINITDFSDLPKDLAIKFVKSNGKRVIAVFSDPNCRYCRQFENNLKEIDNLTVFVYPYNILSEHSIEISKDIWCSSNPAKTWHDWMTDGKTPEKALNHCSFPNQKIRALGQKLKIKSVPTIIFTDGSRVPGAIDAEDLEKKLKSLE